MVKANVMPIVNTDITILLKLCPFLWFFDVFRSIKQQQQKKHFRMYHLYNLFGIIYSEKDFHLCTWKSHGISGLSGKPSIQDKMPLGSLVYTFSCSLTYYFSFFYVAETGSRYAFSYSNASIAPIPWRWLVLSPVLVRLYYIHWVKCPNVDRKKLRIWTLLTQPLLGKILKWKAWSDE